MSSLAKGMNVGNLARSNYMLTGLVLLLVIALFFIPELVDFQKSGPSVATKSKTISQEAEFVEEGTSGGTLDKLVDFMRVRRGHVTEHEADQVALRGSLKSAGSKSEKATLSWQYIRSEVSRKSLVAAQRGAIAIAKSLPTEIVASKFALLNFANGVGRVLQSGSEKLFTPEQAIAYIEYLDSAVTETLIKDRVERSDFKRWAELRLAPLLEPGRRFSKESLVPPFNPQLTLSWVEVLQPADRFGRWKPNGKAYFRARGYVMGKDAKRIMLWRNGEPVRRLSVRKRPDQKGRRFFRIPQRDAHGLYTVVVTDKNGAEYKKSYTFYGRATRFRWRREATGRFALPFREFDPRLDSYFAVGSSGSGSSRGFGNIVFGSGSGYVAF